MAEGRIRTVTARPNAESLIKPGELVDLVEVTPLTLNDRRIYNQLLENAWDAIDKPVTHLIPKSALRGSHNSNDRVGESLERLMSAIVKVAVIWDGEPAIERVQLLGGNLESGRADGMLEYEIPARLRKIIGNSQVFARLQREVMFALSSKYALTLYEMVQKRGNLRWKASEKFTLDSLRGIMGVPKGKLTSWSNLKLRAIDPAVAEVKALSDFMVEIAPIKTGRAVTHVELRWWRKDGDATGAADRALQFSKVGRRVRAEGRTEELSVPGVGSLRARPAWLESRGAALQTATYETARLRHPGYDIYFIEGEWRSWAAGKEPATDPDRAFLAFFRSYAEKNPL
ncbi:replication initiation protein [Paracoccus aminophilus]|uniref:Replication initiation protein B n=2 Tax=Paracoccus aminophilus TaxID=34003 RepID=S5YGL4_PARAH|nr:replication initiation protein [Paracoccus aminophilus]ACY78311.1 RepA [Paracoccus aminophilus]AGT10593.1 replication initiation protein B [Paracoccus aminophilus JCM 7686]